MPRFNKITERYFCNIDAKKFLTVDKSLDIPVSDELKELKEKYYSIIRDNYDALNSLAKLEEIIIQTRAKEAIESELRLSLSKNYIYARSIFFRKDNKMNDIRVLIGKTEEFGNDLDVLLNDTVFRQLCKKKLTKAMNTEIQKNIKSINKVYAKY